MKRFLTRFLSVWNYLLGEGAGEGRYTENWGLPIRGGSNGTGTTHLQTKALSHLKILSPPKLCLHPNPIKHIRYTTSQNMALDEQIKLYLHSPIYQISLSMLIISFLAFLIYSKKY